MTYDSTTELGGIRELYTALLAPPPTAPGHLPLTDAQRIELGRRLAAAVKAQDDALTGSGPLPDPWLGHGSKAARARVNRQGHRHAEAYMLMTYVSDDGHASEQIWNSRDGVTPFVIALRDGRRATHHADPHRDRYDPGYQPQPGQRVFADMNTGYAQRIAAANYGRFAADPALASRLAELGTKGQAIRYFATQYTSQPGTPVLLTVQPDGTWDLDLQAGKR
jgi:hypothetical protein